MEHQITNFKPQARWRVFSVLILVLLAGLGPYFISFQLEGLALYAIIGLYLLILLLLVIVPFMKYLSKKTEITTERIIVSEGVFVRQRQELFFGQVAEMRLRRNVVQRMFKSGDIVLRSVTGATLTLRDVPYVRAVADLLQDLLRTKQQV